MFSIYIREGRKKAQVNFFSIIFFQTMGGPGYGETKKLSDKYFSDSEIYNEN